MRFIIFGLLAFSASIFATTSIPTSTSVSGSFSTSNSTIVKTRTSSADEAAVTGNYNTCQSYYKTCLSAGTDATACGCLLSTCMGEDTSKDGGICAAATVGLTVVATTTAAPPAISAAGSASTTSSKTRTASATIATSTGGSSAMEPLFGLMSIGALVALVGST